MIQFAAPYVLLLLVLVPAVVALWWRGVRRGASASRLLWRGAISRGSRVRPLLLFAGTACAIVAAAGPSWGVRTAESRSQAADVLVVVDVSRSMGVEDVGSSRLEAAKAILGTTLRRMEGQRVGVVLFGGSARIRFPLTADLEAAARVIEGLQPGMRLVDGGSNVKSGLEVALRSFDLDRPSGKLILLVTDGDDLGPSPQAAADSIRQAGITFLVAGVGSSAGGRVPVFDAKSDSFVDKLAADGSPIVSSLDATFLRDLARAGGGTYLGNDLGRLPSAVVGRTSLLGRTSLEVRTVESPIARFHLFAAAALVLLVGGWLWQVGVSRRREIASLALALTAGLVLAACATSAHRENEAGRELFNEGDIDGAIEKFFAASAADPTDVGVARNLAIALISAERYEEGAQAARRSIRAAVGEERAGGLRLLGSAQFAQGDLEGAAEAFRRSLILSPGDDLARHDYEVVYRLIQQLRQRPAGGAGDQSDGGSSATPAGGATEVPGAGSTPPADGNASNGQGEAAGGRAGAQSGRGHPGSIDAIEKRVAGIDDAVAELLASGERLTAEAAARILDLLAERSRLNSLRDAFFVGSDPGDY